MTLMRTTAELLLHNMISGYIYLYKIRPKAASHLFFSHIFLSLPLLPIPLFFSFLFLSFPFFLPFLAFISCPFSLPFLSSSSLSSFPLPSFLSSYFSSFLLLPFPFLILTITTLFNRCAQVLRQFECILTYFKMCYHNLKVFQNTEKCCDNSHGVGWAASAARLKIWNFKSLSFVML